MSKERLDAILLRNGVATEDQIRQALMRQKTHGGRLGSHLLYFKAATEAQLVRALGEQCGCPGVELTGRDVPPAVLEKVPLKLMDGAGIFPFDFEPGTRTLHLAMVDPEDTEVLLQVQQASMAREVKPYAAVESVLRKSVHVHCYGGSWDDPHEQIVEMPDLFREAADPDTAEPEEGTLPPESAAAPRRALLVTQKSFLKTFLVPIFEREGIQLRVACNRDELDTLKEQPLPEEVLLSEEMEDVFRDWLDATGGPCSDRPFAGDVTAFCRVSESLLERTVPYPQIMSSLLLTLEQTAEMQCEQSGWTPPYSAMQEEAASLARILGLDRKASDGLRIAILLLVPASGDPLAGAASGEGVTVDCFRNVVEALNRARSAFTPWGVNIYLRSFLELLSGNTCAPVEGSGRDAAGIGPQILAVVWYRHLAFHGQKVGEGAVPETLRAGLRALQSRGVSTEVVEAYLLALSRPGRTPRPGVRHDVFLLFKPDHAPRELAARLRDEGYRVVELEELHEARHLYHRKPPDIIIMDHDAFQEQAISFCRAVKEEAEILLFAVTHQTRPSVMLQLLDTGFDDVFSPPFNLDLIATRIHGAVASMERRERMAMARKGFSGSFRDLPFVDLIQALSLSRRSVQIDLEDETGERARLYLRDGTLTHASCGHLEAEPAIYRIIRWGEAGTFQLKAAEGYPPDNVHVPTDFVLLEGVRRLDEGTA